MLNFGGPVLLNFKNCIIFLNLLQEKIEERKIEILPINWIEVQFH